jgi:hypothetical protein
VATSDDACQPVPIREAPRQAPRRFAVVVKPCSVTTLGELALGLRSRRFRVRITTGTLVKSYAEVVCGVSLLCCLYPISGTAKAYPILPIFGLTTVVLVVSLHHSHHQRRPRPFIHRAGARDSSFKDFVPSCWVVRFGTGGVRERPPLGTDKALTPRTPYSWWWQKCRSRAMLAVCVSRRRSGDSLLCFHSRSTSCKTRRRQQDETTGLSGGGCVSLVI